jgi:receptor protein-tyrosine kinase
MVQRSRNAKGELPSEFSGFLPLVKRWWWLLALSTVIAGVGGYLVSTKAAARYQSVATALVGPFAPSKDQGSAASANTLTYAKLATSNTVLDRVRTKLGLPLTTTQLRQDATVIGDEFNRVLTVKVESSDPELAPAIANALITELQAYAKNQYEGGVVPPEGEINVVDAAGYGYRVGERRPLVAALAAIAGLVVALALALLAEFLRTTIRDEQELAQLAGVPVLGAVTASSRRDGRGAAPLVVHGQPGSRTVAPYRLLAAEIELSGGSRPPRSVVVLGSSPADGSGEVAANIAATFASVGGKRVALVDANAATTEVTRLFGLDEPAVSDAGEATYFRSIHIPTLEIVPRRSRAGRAQSSDEIAAALREMLATHDLVVVAPGTFQESPDALAWTRVVDTTVLAAAKDRARRGDVAEAVESLRLVGARLLGAILVESGSFGDWLFRWAGRSERRRRAAAHISPSEDAASRPAGRPRRGVPADDSEAAHGAQNGFPAAPTQRPETAAGPSAAQQP